MSDWDSGDAWGEREFSEEKSEEKATRSLRTTILWTFEELGISFGIVWVVFGYYGILILHFVYAISMFVSFIVEPIHYWGHLLWLFASIAQCLMDPPYIQFFIFYIMESVVHIVGIIPQVGIQIVNDWATIFEGIRNKRKGTGTNCSMCCKGFGMHLLEFMALVINIGIMAGVILVGMLILPSYISCIVMCVGGLIVYLPVIIQIFIAVAPVYYYWWRLLWYGPTEPVDWVQRITGKISEFIGTRKGWWKFAMELAVCDKYNVLHDYAVVIATDKTHERRNRWILWIATLGNIGYLGVNVFRAWNNYGSNWEAYFTVSLVCRLLFLPLLAYFNIFFVFVVGEKCADTQLRWIMKSVAYLAILIQFIAAGVQVAANNPVTFYSSLRTLSPAGGGNTDWRNDANLTWDHGDLYPSVCHRGYYGMNLVEILGLVLPAYDQLQGPEQFELLLSSIFGENWNNSMDYVHVHDDDFKATVYNMKDSNVSVIAIPGITPHKKDHGLAFQIELLIVEYAIPLMESVIILYDLMVSMFLEPIVSHAYSLGSLWFNPEPYSRYYRNVAVSIYEKYNLQDRDVIFAGFNYGGFIAKAAGMTVKRHAVSGLSVSIAKPVYTEMMKITSEDSIFVTNVYVLDGLASKPEPGEANNIVLPYSNIAFESYNPGWCLMAMACADYMRYQPYCSLVIKEDVSNLLHEALASISSLETRDRRVII